MSDHIRYFDTAFLNMEDKDISGYTTPGYYFTDEAEFLHGPFDTEKAASIALNVYCEENL